MNIAVSDAEWSDLPGQVRDAEIFLRENADEIEALRTTSGVDDFVLDFPIELRADGVKYLVQSDRFPASLVELAGAAGLALEFTIYN